jgi:hypothetical protein
VRSRRVVPTRDPRSSTVVRPSPTASGSGYGRPGRLSEKAVLDPFTMSGEAALALLRELVETAAIVTRDLDPA